MNSKTVSPNLNLKQKLLWFTIVDQITVIINSNFDDPRSNPRGQNRKRVELEVPIIKEPRTLIYVGI